jgi:HK97 family phage prohead protease
MSNETGLEHKFARFGDGLSRHRRSDDRRLCQPLRARRPGRRCCREGRVCRSLAALAAAGRRVKMLWQHDPAQPIGIWDEVREDARGLWVKGRLLPETRAGPRGGGADRGRAIDGLSIGYRTLRATKNDKGRRLLTELELWEVSLVTFPMLPSARVAAKGEEPGGDRRPARIGGGPQGARRDLARR